MTPSVSLLIPAYNEEATLEETVCRGMKVLKECTTDYEVVILDDASRDGTAAIMESLRRQDPEHIRLLKHKTNRGIALAFEELYRAATKDYVYLIPGDNQYPAEALHQIMPMLAAYDIVVCKRARKPYTWWRHVVSWSFRLLPRVLFRVDLHDPGSTKCVKREIITRVQVSSKGVFAEAERLIRAARRGYRIGTVRIAQEPRQGGKARGARFGLVLQAMKDLFLLWVRLVILRQKP